MPALAPGLPGQLIICTRMASSRRDVMASFGDAGRQGGRSRCSLASSALCCVSCFIRAPPAGTGVSSLETVALERPLTMTIGLHSVESQSRASTAQLSIGLSRRRNDMTKLLALANGPTLDRPTTMQYPGLPRRDPTAPGLSPAGPCRPRPSFVRKAPRPVTITIPCAILCGTFLESAALLRY